MPSREGCCGGGGVYTILPQNFQPPLNLEANTAAAINYFIGLETLFSLTNVFLTMLHV